MTTAADEPQQSIDSDDQPSRDATEDETEHGQREEPGGGRRTGEQQAEENRESDPPA